MLSACETLGKRERGDKERKREREQQECVSPN